MSLGRNSAQFGDKPGCTVTDTIDDKMRDFPTIFVALIRCAVTAPVFAWFAKTVFFSNEAGQLILCSKTGVYRGIHYYYVFFFALKHRFWVLVSSMRPF